MKFFTTIRGTGIMVFATDFTIYDSFSLGGGPDELYAKTEDGEEFNLTAEEYEQLSEQAVELYTDQLSDPDMK